MAISIEAPTEKATLHIVLGGKVPGPRNLELLGRRSSFVGLSTIGVSSDVILRRESNTGGMVVFGEYKPNNPQNYRLLDPITRDNFASMLATSFRFSSAVDERHMLFFEYVKAQTRFDYLTTLMNFSKAGGWDTFSREEQQLFMGNFDSVKRHATVMDGLVSEEFHESPAFNLEVQLEQFTLKNQRIEELKRQRNIKNFESIYGSLNSMDKKAFVANLNDMYPIRKK